MAILPAQALSALPLVRTLGMPDSGPRCIPIVLDFSAAPSYSLDYSNQANLGMFDAVQTVWVDNYGNAQVLAIYIPLSSQTLQIPAQTQGYFPVLCPNPIRMVFSSTGNTRQQVILCNFPILT